MADVMELPRLERRSIHVFQGIAAGDRLRVDLSEVGGLDKPVVSLRFDGRGQVTAGGGAAVSGLIGDAPVPFLFNQVRVEGNHREVALPFMLNAQGRDLYWLLNRLNGIVDPLVAGTPLAGANGDFAATLEIPLSFVGVPSAWDARVLSRMTLSIDVGALTDYATTSVASIQACSIEVSCLVMEEGAPPVGWGHYVPLYQQVQRLTESQQPSLPTTGIGGGRLMALHFRYRDASVTGNGDRPNGAARRLSFRQGGRYLLRNLPWPDLEALTNKDYPLGNQTANPTGLIMWKPSPMDDPAEMPNLAAVPAVAEYNTVEAVRQGITGVTAAAGDSVELLVLSLVPTPLAARALDMAVRAVGQNA